VEYSKRRKKYFMTGDDRLDAKIHELVSETGQGENADLVEEVMATALKTYHDKLNRGDMKILNTAIRELRYSLHIFEPGNNVPHSSILYYQAQSRLGKSLRIVEMCCF